MRGTTTVLAQRAIRLRSVGDKATPGVLPKAKSPQRKPALPKISPPSRAYRSTRTCSRCHEPKPADRFRLDSRGYQRSHCIDCSLLDTQDWRARHRVARLALRRERYAQAGAAGRKG